MYSFDKREWARPTGQIRAGGKSVYGLENLGLGIGLLGKAYLLS